MQYIKENNAEKEISPQDPLEQVIEDLRRLRYFTGHPGRFWPAFLELVTHLSGGIAGLLLVRDKDAATWKRLSVWPPEEGGLLHSPGSPPVIIRVAEASLANGCAWETQQAAGDNGSDIVVFGLYLESDQSNRAHAAIFLLDNIPAEATLQEVAMRLKPAADTPLIYELGRAAHKAKNDLVHFAGALDLMLLLNAEARYMAAAMTFVNETASRYRCTRVSLGWLGGEYIRLQAISHMERFEKKMDIVRLLEAAMEEALDQDEEILWPPLAESTAVVRDHETFSRRQDVRYMLSLPIRIDDTTVGVLTCERDKKPFSEVDVRGVRVLSDQAARRLADLKERDRWFGARMISTLRKGASRLLGVEHTFAKFMGILGCCLLVLLLFGRMPYRVDAPFIIRSDNVRYLPAPFEGYIDEALVEVGEQVDKGRLLLTLDTRDLLLEESAAIANQIRYSQEAEKARAEGALAEMKIALALTEQARARLDLVRYRLSRAEVRAPFKGIVVEGDFEELQGAPIKKGDILFKVARIKEMYAELDVSEQDIHELARGASGEIVFVSKPQVKFPIEVVSIDPVAQVKKEEGNVFSVRCRFSEGMADWWRPGMSGVAKISVEERNILWILTHRTIDFIRIRLWW